MRRLDAPSLFLKNKRFIFCPLKGVVTYKADGAHPFKNKIFSC